MNVTASTAKESLHSVGRSFSCSVGRSIGQSAAIESVNKCRQSDKHSNQCIGSG